ncbi:MAG TPA: hypothetical protein VNQ76_21195 [Planctomicrobium sp.]|nr:hypothetical protein [Planctomicrobium sp.]
MKTITIDDVTTNPEQAKPQIQTVRWRPNFETPGVIPYDVAQTIKSERRPGIWYVNPVGTVHASVGSADFLNAVRKKQREWYRLLSRQFGNGWRRAKRGEEDLWKLAYEYDGIIVINGVILRFEAWDYNRRNVPRARNRVTTKNKTFHS